MQAVNPAFEGIIRLIEAFLVHRVRHLFGHQHGKFERLFARGAAHISVIADGFGNDVPRPLQSLLNGGHLLVEIRLFDNVFYIAPGQWLFEDIFSQPFQTLFTRDHGTRPALGFVWRVQILQGSHCPGHIDRFFELAGQFALFFDGFQDGGPALVDKSQADDLIGDNAHLLIIQRAGHFLAVAGNKGDCVAFVEQADSGLHLGGFNMKLGGDGFGVIHRVSGKMDWR